MTMDTHIRFRLSFLAILFLISIVMLNAQVKIKEKVEIAPRTISTPQANMSSSDLPCFGESSIIPNSSYQKIEILRRCKIIGTGTCISGNSLLAVFLGGGDFPINLANATDIIYAGYTPFCDDLPL